MNIYIIFILLLVIFLFVKYYEKIRENYSLQKKKNIILQQKKNLLKYYLLKSKKPFIWVYLENNHNYNSWISLNNKNNIPSYQLLCIMSIYCHCKDNFNIIVINPALLYKYLPDFPINAEIFSKLSLEKKQDFIGSYVLYKFGGIYIKPNVLVMKNLKNLYNKLNKYDIITTGCNKNNLQCVYDNISPNSDILICKKNLEMIKEYKDKLLDMVSSYNYSSYNFNKYHSCLLNNCIKKYTEKNKIKYLQLPFSYNGTRNTFNKNISTFDLLSNNEILFLNKKDMHFVILDSSVIEKSSKLKWFYNYSIKNIMDSNIMVSKLFRTSFQKKSKIVIDNSNNPCNYNQKNCSCQPYFGNYQCNLKLETRKIEFPPKNQEELNLFLKNCNYFDVPKWYLIYNLPTPNR